VRTILALQPGFLAQWQREILESREGHIRVKSLGTGQQMINCRVRALKVLQYNKRRLRKIRRLSATGIEATLSEVWFSLFGLQSARDPTNRAEYELTELTVEVRSVFSASETAGETLSRRADGTQELFSRDAAEVAALRASAKSAQKELALAPEQLSRSEATDGGSDGASRSL
jgi:hypothetical protein